MSLLRALSTAVFVVFAFFYGSFQCKNFLDRAPELEFKKKFLEQSTEKLLARFVMLNSKMALSQYYLFRMITHFTTFDLPADHDHDAEHDERQHESESHIHDAVDIKARLAAQKYMLSHIDEFFDLDPYYALMSLVLEFDPKNDFVCFFGMGFSINPAMARGMCAVLEKAYSQNPEWGKAFDCGWLYFYILREYDKARLWLRRAKGFSGAPPIAQGIYAATFLLDKKYELAIQTLVQQIQHTRSPTLIPALERRLHWYEALSLLYRKAVEFQQRFGKPVSDLSELVSSGLLQALPADQLGGGFYWDAKHQEPASKNTYDMRKTSFPWDSGEIFPEGGAEHDSESGHETHAG